VLKTALVGFYSLSTQIQKERKGYYDILEKTQEMNLSAAFKYSYPADTQKTGMVQMRMEKVFTFSFFMVHVKNWGQEKVAT
jgi:hypothetical protein